MRYLELITDLAYQNGIGSDISEVGIGDAGTGNRSWAVFGSPATGNLPKFFKVVAPPLCDGTVMVRFDSSKNAVPALHGPDGRELAEINAAGPGGEEELDYNSVSSGQTYYVRAGLAEYGSAGSHSLGIEFGLLVPSSLTDAEGEIVLLNDGNGTTHSPDAQFRTPSIRFRRLRPV